MVFLAVISMDAIASIILSADPNASLNEFVSHVEIPADSSQNGSEVQYSVFAGDSLFLDYSVFSDTSVLTFNGNVFLTANQISIFSYDYMPTMPDFSVTTVFNNLDVSMSSVGGMLIYSDTPIVNGIFEAANSIYIGNYSSIKPVPLPAAFLLFLSGVVAISLSVVKRPLRFGIRI